MPIQRWPFTVNKTLTPFKNPWVTVIVDDVTHISWEAWQWVRTRLIDWVSILPIDKEGNVYLIKNFVYGIGKDMLHVAGWGIDDWYPAEQTAVAELREEVWIKARKMHHIWWMHWLPSKVEQIEQLYIATELTFWEQNLWSFESDIQIVKMSLDEAFQKVRSWDISDSFSKVLIYEAWVRRSLWEISF